MDLAAEGTFISITGDDLVDDKVPTQFADVCVEVNGIRSPMFFVSPGQLNLQAPTLGALGPVTVEVITGCGGSSEQKSAPEMVTVDAVTPAFFLKVFTDPGPIAALHGGGPDVVGDPNVVPGATGPAQPGEFISLFATGFGPTIPALEAGEIPQIKLPDSFGQARVTGDVSSITIGGIPLNPDVAGEVFSHIFSLMYDLLTFQPSSASLLVGVQAQSGRQGGQHLMGEKETKPFQLTFNGLLKVDFQGSRVTSDGGLILVRRLKQTLGTLRPTPGTAVGLRITCVRGASSCILCERDVRIGNSGFYIGTAPCCAGLYQLVVKVPDNAPDGDLPVVVTIDGVSTPEGPFVTVQAP